MPFASPHRCSEIGCPNLVRGAARCIACSSKRSREYEDERGTAAERGYTHRWAEYSKRYRRENPICVHCDARGKTWPSECVDHIIAVNGPDDPLFWEPTNHQALCNDCHRIKTNAEDGGFGRPRARPAPRS